MTAKQTHSGIVVHFLLSCAQTRRRVSSYSPSSIQMIFSEIGKELGQMIEDRLGAQPILGIRPDLVPHNLPGPIDDEHSRRSDAIAQ